MYDFSTERRLLSINIAVFCVHSFQTLSFSRYGLNKGTCRFILNVSSFH